MKNVWKTSRRNFIKSGIALTAGLPLIEGCHFFGCSNESDELYAIFRNPPVSAKPFVRWWWSGNKLTAKEILRELDVMHEAGIGGVEINPIAFPGTTGAQNEQGYQGTTPQDFDIPSLQWLSPEWIEMVKIALKGAEERGMICDIIVGSGWPFGAEFLTGDERTQLLTLTSKKVKGSGKITLKVADLLEEASPEIYSKYEGSTRELYALCLAPVKMETFTEPVYLPFEKSEEISVDVPDGEYILYAIVKVTGFQAVIFGAPGAAGPVLNHYNQTAVEKFLNRMSDNLFPKLSGLKGFRAMFCDSMELEGANWCHDFVDEFKRRNGYDVSPYLPYILYKVGHQGHAIEDAVITHTDRTAKDEIERVRYDFFVTCMDMVCDRFLKPYTQWCNRYGFQSRVQAYGREFHPLEASMKVDIPEGETWFWYTDSNYPQNDFIRCPSYTSINKYVSSAAHLSGKKTVSCEEITNVHNVFNATLERIKITGDQSNTSGITHSVLCGYNYSPPEVPFPGWVRFGAFFDEKNTWWPFFKLWTTYKARISALLMATEYFADIAVLHPLADLWTKYGTQRDPFPQLLYPNYQYRVWEAIHRNGNSCDYTSETIIQQSVTTDGFLKYRHRAYHTLILLEVESMQPATAETIASFVKNGGKVIFVGKEPYKSTGLKDYQANDEKIRQTIADMKKNHATRVFTVEAPTTENIDGWFRYGMTTRPIKDIDEWFRKVQKQCGIRPYMDIDKPNPYIAQIRHLANGLDVFFVTNCHTEERFVVQAEFFRSKGQPWLWNPETGDRSRYPGTSGNDRTLTIDLPPASSQLIVFDEHTRGKDVPVITKKQTTGMELTGWNVRMQHINGSVEQRTFTILFDLASDESTRSFAGYLFYEKLIDEDTSSFSWLDLGRVFGVSEVTLNGESIGCRWYGQHLYHIPEHLVKAPKKTLVVKITTTVGNYLKSSPENVVGYGWTRNQGWQPVGILGPVKFL